MNKMDSSPFCDLIDDYVCVVETEVGSEKQYVVIFVLGCMVYDYLVGAGMHMVESTNRTTLEYSQ